MAVCHESGPRWACRAAGRLWEKNLLHMRTAGIRVLCLLTLPNRAMENYQSLVETAYVVAHEQVHIHGKFNHMTEARIFSMILSCVSRKGSAIQEIVRIAASMGDQAPPRRHLDAGLRWLLHEQLIEHASGRYFLTEKGSALLDGLQKSGPDDAARNAELEGRIRSILEG